MEHAAKVLADFGVPFEKKVVSAHRTPELLYDYAKSAESRGLHCIIAVPYKHLTPPKNRYVQH